VASSSVSGCFATIVIMLKRLIYTAAALSAPGIALTVASERLVRPRLFYRGDWHAEPPDAIGAPYEEAAIYTADGMELQGWLFKQDRPSPTLLFCHGTSYNASDMWLTEERVEAFGAFLRGVGCNFFVFDYRGYNRSAGIPSEAGTYSDARGAWLFASGELGWPPEKIVIWGQSLGGAVAIKLTCDLLDGPSDLWPQPRRENVCAPAGLVVECAFTSMAQMSHHRMGFLGIPHWLLYAGYDNLARAPKLKLPVFHVHGQADEIIPYAFGRTLDEAIAGPKRCYWPEKSMHNDIWLTSQAELAPQLRQFFAEATVD